MQGPYFTLRLVEIFFSMASAIGIDEVLSATGSSTPPDEILQAP